MLDSLTKWIKGLFESIWQAFVDFFVNVVLTIFDMLKDIFYFIVDTVLSFVITLLDAVTAPLSGFNPSTYINALPADVLNIMGLIGIGECITIIIAAIGIRLVLQLIPFTRLGS